MPEASGETDLGAGGSRMRRHIRRLALATSSAALVAGLMAQGALAGEITGNGKLLEMNGRSECSFSGQEDLQWYFDDDDTMPKPVATRGDPGRAQSWGRIPKVVRDEIAQFGAHPGTACNPIKSQH
jgi:hypothetical protein